MHLELISEGNLTEKWRRGWDHLIREENLCVILCTAAPSPQLKKKNGKGTRQFCHVYHCVSFDSVMMPVLLDSTQSFCVSCYVDYQVHFLVHFRFKKSTAVFFFHEKV